MDIDDKARSIAQEIIQHLLDSDVGQTEDLEAVRVRTYADEEAYTLLGPTETEESWPLHIAINRHLALGFEEHGLLVEFVVLSGNGYRQWLRDRTDTAAMRHRYGEIMEHAFPTFTNEKRTLQ
jgi:hypothetical protein